MTLSIESRTTQDESQIRNPYPGLRPFTEDESHLLFGREGQADVLVRRLAAQKFLAVLGTSGTGKSSLVKAALLPSLRAGYLGSADSDWLVVSLEPGGDPLGRLSSALSKSALVNLPANLDQVLRGSNFGLRDLVALHAPRATNVLILVDQFEELFRSRTAERAEGVACAELEERKAFVKLLLEASIGERSTAYVLITMRSEYLGQCTRFRGLPEALNAGQYLIPRMSRAELRQSIEGPARIANTSITNRLLQRLLNDVGEDPDQLPLLQHALMRTWEYWKHQRDTDASSTPVMDIIHYEAIGRMADALCRHANEAYKDAQQIADGARICKLIFQRLRERDANDDEVRRPSSVRELMQVTEVPLETLGDVLAPFRAPARAFLTPALKEPLCEDTEINVSHECLFRKWTLLSEDWTPEELRARDRYRALVERSQSGDIMASSVLVQMLHWWNERAPNAAWAERYGGDFAAAKRFLQKSIGRLGAKVLFSIAVSLLVIAGIGWGMVERSYGSDIRQANERTEHSNAVLATHLIVQAAATRASEPGSARVAGLLAAAAHDQKELLEDENMVLEVQRIFWNALSRLPLQVQRLSFPNLHAREVALGGRGRLLAVADMDGNIHVQSLGTSPLSAAVAAGSQVYHVELNVDGTVLAAVTERRLRVWQRTPDGSFGQQPTLDEACTPGGWVSLTDNGDHVAASCNVDGSTQARMFTRATDGVWHEHEALRIPGVWLLSRDGTSASAIQTDHSGGENHAYIQVDLLSRGCEWSAKKRPDACITRRRVPYAEQWEAARDDLKFLAMSNRDKSIEIIGGSATSSTLSLEAVGEVDAVVVADGGRTLLSLAASDNTEQGTTLQVWRLAGDGTPREISRVALGKLARGSAPAFDGLSGQLAVVNDDGGVAIVQPSPRQAFAFNTPPSIAPEGALAVGNLRQNAHAIAIRLDAQPLSTQVLPLAPCGSSRIAVGEGSSTIAMATCEGELGWPGWIDTLRAHDARWEPYGQRLKLGFLDAFFMSNLQLGADGSSVAWLAWVPAVKAQAEAGSKKEDDSTPKGAYSISRARLDNSEAVRRVKLPEKVRAVSLTRNLDTFWIAASEDAGWFVQRCTLDDKCDDSATPRFPFPGTVVTRLASSHDDKLLGVVVSTDDATSEVRVLSSATGEALAVIKSRQPRMLAFSAASERLVILEATAARVWQLPAALPTPTKEKEIARFPADAETRSVTLSADGSWLYLVGSDGVDRFPIDEDLVRYACSHVQPALSEVEWNEALPTRVPYHRICRGGTN